MIPTTSSTFTCTLCGTTQPADSEHLSGFGPKPDDYTSRAIFCRACVERARTASVAPIPSSIYTHPLHPETCKCRGTQCRYVGEVIVDDPCEEPQPEPEEDAAYDRGAESRYFETGRWSR